MIVPAIVSNVQDYVMMTKLKSTYSILSQALRMAEAHNGTLVDWDLGTADTEEGSLKLYDYITPELIKSKECKSTSGCFADEYKTLQGTIGSWQPNTWQRYQKCILNNGVPVLFWSGGTGGNNYQNNTDLYGAIRVDLNGDKKPNKYGYDFFSFSITRKGLRPTGETQGALNRYCNHSGDHAENGIGCTAWAIYKGNFDYKHKDISWN